MWVQCITTEPETAAEGVTEPKAKAHILRKAGSGSNVQGIDCGTFYVVVAVHARPWVSDFVVMPLDGPLVSVPYPSQFFDVADGRLSRYWRYEIDQRSDTHFLAIPGWDFQFFEALVDGEESADKRFQGYALAMSYEFAHPEITDPVRRLTEGWVMCPNCTESWRVVSDQEMLLCSDCRMHWLNPW